MSSKIIKFVAGGGKTTYSKKLMSKVPNGLYLAFTTSVVDEMSKNPFIARTIDSLFASFIIPKFVELIPLINSSSNITFSDSSNESTIVKAASNIRVSNDGSLYNGNKKICQVSLYTNNNVLHKLPYFPNSQSLKYIFGKDSTKLTHQQRGQISDYIISNFPDELIDILTKRFSFIIIDEAQDLSDFRERFCELLYKSKISLRILGDDNQNINNGGTWFASLSPTKVKSVTFRCPEPLCKWIRDNLYIEIYGNKDIGNYFEIGIESVKKLDNGSRVLLYKSRTKKASSIIDTWVGKVDTIQSAKGTTIVQDVIILGDSLNIKNMYTAMTRTTKNVYSTIKKIN